MARLSMTFSGPADKVAGTITPQLIAQVPGSDLIRSIGETLDNQLKTDGAGLDCAIHVSGEGDNLHWSLTIEFNLI